MGTDIVLAATIIPRPAHESSVYVSTARSRQRVSGAEATVPNCQTRAAIVKQSYLLMALTLHVEAMCVMATKLERKR